MDGTDHSWGSRRSWQRFRGACRSTSNAGWVAASLLAGGLAGVAWTFGLTASASAAEEIESSADLVAVAESLTDDVADISHLAVDMVPQDQLGLGEIVSGGPTEQLVSDLAEDVDELVDVATQQSEPTDDHATNADTEPTSTDQSEPTGGSEPASVLDSVSDAIDPLAETVSPLVESVEETTKQVSQSSGDMPRQDDADDSFVLPVVSDLPYVDSAIDSVTHELNVGYAVQPVEHTWQSVSSALESPRPLAAANGGGLSALAAEPWHALTSSLPASVHEPASATSALAVDSPSWWSASHELTHATTEVTDRTSVSDLSVRGDDDVIAEAETSHSVVGHDGVHDAFGAISALDAEKSAKVHHSSAPTDSPGSGLTVNDLSNFPGGAPASSTGSSADNAPPVVCHASSPSQTQVSCVKAVAGKLGQPMDRTAELSIVPD